MRAIKGGGFSRDKLKTRDAAQQGQQFELTDSFIKKCEEDGNENT